MLDRAQVVNKARGLVCNSRHYRGVFTQIQGLFSFPFDRQKFRISMYVVWGQPL